MYWLKRPVTNLHLVISCVIRHNYCLFTVSFGTGSGVAHTTATRYLWLFGSRSTSDTARDDSGGNIFSLFKMAPSQSGSGENN